MNNGCCPCGQDKSKCEIQNGKGDSPRNLSDRFRDNYGRIQWGGGDRSSEGKRSIKTYA